jgi:hypothetical protein
MQIEIGHGGSEIRGFFPFDKLRVRMTDGKNNAIDFRLGTLGIDRRIFRAPKLKCLHAFVAVHQLHPENTHLLGKSLTSAFLEFEVSESKEIP